MSDEQGQEQDETATGHDAELGAWLRSGRESAGLGVEAVAAALHLDPGVVTALESDDFGALGAPVFVRGHLRTLAGHLGLDAAEALRRYEARAGASGVEPPDLIVQYQRPIRRHRVMPALAIAAAIVIVAVLVGVFVLWPGGGTVTGERGAPTATDLPTAAETTSQRASDPAPVREDAAPRSADSDFASRLAEARARSTQATADPVAAPPTESQPPDPAPAGASASGLTLTFSGECWYEVRDADGRRLATGTAAAGDVRTVDGPRPLAVTLGVADAVVLTLDGDPVEITAAVRRGRSARLTLR